MTTISNITKNKSSKIDFLDLELIIADAIGKSREFVLAHPEFELDKKQTSKIRKNLARRMACEPLAYILRHKEFYGLDFCVNKNTLIPRPETEILVELAGEKIGSEKTCIFDIGTGSGNIIISLAKNFGKNIKNKFVAVDISEKALRVAKKNSRFHYVDKKIKFIQSNLLEKIILKKNNFDCEKIIFIANLPYLSKKIYARAHDDVKKFEPRLALVSKNDGLAHYEKLLKQIKNINNKKIIILLEISPEQKNKLEKIVCKIFPKARVKFHKDLAGKWRICQIEL